MTVVIVIVIVVVNVIVVVIATQSFVLLAGEPPVGSLSPPSLE